MTLLLEGIRTASNFTNCVQIKNNILFFSKTEYSFSQANTRVGVPRIFASPTESEFNLPLQNTI